MEKKVFLLRHGLTDYNGLYIGSSDVGLAEEGKVQVSLTGQILKQKKIQKIFCSPMRRCRDTFSLLKFDIDCQFSDDLREIDFGRWEKKSFEDIKDVDKNIVADWARDGEGFCFPAGESILHFNERVKIFSQALLNVPEKEILIIAHGGTIRQLLCIFLQIASEKKMIFSIEPGCFATVELYGDIGRITGLNERG